MVGFLIIWFFWSAQWWVYKDDNLVGHATQYEGKISFSNGMYINGQLGIWNTNARDNSQQCNELLAMWE